ncbi:helix-turn-helix domain-containing protein [Kineosporia succinea]|uniref:DNA-binding transcriptional MerR regulator n=1 Tax=Kineosporia succinea TaxID=84632 RepID=A0ABT9P0M3_9ACTN|nr:helix-turn-helix domain-containing protein [Kineosporia succinea]MDP9826067.1 DNA-binding transcriptional MerR regulator [Kineosporia succinea]
MGAQDTFTIEELATAAGMTPRNVRAYRTKGLLAPPTRVGRTSRYQESHLRRLRDIRQLRDAGLPLKMIIDAAARGEDLGPTGALWQAAGPTAVERGRRRMDGGGDGSASTGTSVLVDPEAYGLMRTLRESGVPASTVLRVALRAAAAGRLLAQELSDVLAEGDSAKAPAAGNGFAGTPQRAVAEQAPGPVPDLVVLDGEAPAADVIDLATAITRGVLGSSRLAD